MLKKRISLALTAFAVVACGAIGFVTAQDKKLSLSR